MSAQTATFGRGNFTWTLYPIILYHIIIHSNSILRINLLHQPMKCKIGINFTIIQQAKLKFPVLIDMHEAAIKLIIHSNSALQGQLSHLATVVTLCKLMHSTNQPDSHTKWCKSIVLYRELYIHIGYFMLVCTPLQIAQ